MSFESLGLMPELLRAIADQGYTEPSPIQVKAIVTGDTFSGSMTVGQFGTFPIKAKRE